MGRRKTFLESRKHCPACKAPRMPALEELGHAHFECGLHISLNAGAFAVIFPCPVRSQQVVRHWNQQSAGGE